MDGQIFMLRRGVAAAALLFSLAACANTAGNEPAAPAKDNLTTLNDTFRAAYKDTRAWAIAPEDYHGDWRPAALAGLMLLGYLVVVAVPDIRNFFELAALSLFDYLAIGVVAGLWALGLRLIWRKRLIERFLNLDLR